MLDFVQNPQAKAIFDGGLDPQTLIMNITAFSGKSLTLGTSVVVPDEIQECPRARTAIKHLVDDGRFDYIESGSLLDALYHNVASLPVGYENVVRMVPLSLREFFVALGVQPETLEILEECYEQRREVPPTIHERMLQLTRLYLVCGGMPAAVDQLVTTQDFARVLSAQHEPIHRVLEYFASDQDGAACHHGHRTSSPCIRIRYALAPPHGWLVHQYLYTKQLAIHTT